jgi:hypothetical protein
MSKWPYPIVTVNFIDGSPSGEDVVAIPLDPSTEEELGSGWTAPNSGIQKLLDRVEAALTEAMNGDQLAWEFQGIRRNDGPTPKLLPGETFVAGGLKQVALMFEAVRTFDAYVAQGGDENSLEDPRNLCFHDMTNAYVGGLRDRLDALEAASPKR